MQAYLHFVMSLIGEQGHFHRAKVHFDRHNQAYYFRMTELQKTLFESACLSSSNEETKDVALVTLEDFKRIIEKAVSMDATTENFQIAIKAIANGLKQLKDKNDLVNFNTNAKWLGEFLPQNVFRFMPDYVADCPRIKEEPNGYTLCFKTEKIAEKHLQLIQVLLCWKHPELIASNIMSNKILLQESHFKSYTQLKLYDYLIKSIRWDDLCFINDFIYSITRSKEQQKKFPLRKVGKKKYTVFGDGVYPRDNKPQRYTDEELAKKSVLSQPQATSLMTHCIQSPLFRFKTVPNSKIVAMRFPLEDALLNRLFRHDKGTVNRFYDFNSQKHALEFFTSMIEPGNPKLFKDIDTMKWQFAKPRHSDNRHNSPHSEILARIRWLLEKCIVDIGADSFEARCIAQEFARRLSLRLKLLALEAQEPQFAQKYESNYQIPIDYYMPGSDKHLKPYTPLKQQKDRVKAARIFSNENLRREKFKTNDFEFLLLLNKEQCRKALELRYPENNPLLLTLMRRGLFAIAEFLIEEANFNLMTLSVEKYLVEDDEIFKTILQKNQFYYLYWILSQVDKFRFKVKNYDSPLWYAAEHDSLLCINVLLDHGFNPDDAWRQGAW